jgi:hypothetical protein
MRAAGGAIALALIAAALWLLPSESRPASDDGRPSPSAAATAADRDTITWTDDGPADPFEFIELVLDPGGRAIGAWQAHVTLTPAPGERDRTTGPSLVGLEAGDLPGMDGPPRHDARQVDAGAFIVGHRLAPDVDTAAVVPPPAGASVIAARLHVATGPGRLLVRDLQVFDPDGVPIHATLRLVRRSTAADDAADADDVPTRP